VIDEGTASREGLRIGGNVGMIPKDAVQQFRIVGLAKLGTAESLGQATLAAIDLSTAQRLFDKPGQIDQVWAAAKEGESASDLRKALSSALPSDIQVQTADEADPFDFAGLKQFVDIIKYFFLAFAGIALFVGAFIIFNTFSITVAQRAREFALLRTIGASRPQILRAVVLEAVVVGLIATAVGIAAGLGIAVALQAIMSALDIDLPNAGTVFALRTVLVSLLIGIVVTLVSALVPAVRATRVAPISLLREGAEAPRSRAAPFAPYAALGAIAAGAGLLVYGMFGGDVNGFVRVVTMVLGTLVLFVGVALISPRLVRPLARVLGWPGERLGGVAGRLARQNSARNPGRTAVTASALMIGLALVTFVTVLGQGIRDTWGATVDDQVAADYVLSSGSDWGFFAPAAADRLKSAPGVESVSPVRSGEARLAGTNTQASVSGIEPATIADFYRFQWKKGSDELLRELGAGGAIVHTSWADDNHLGVGDRIRIVTADNDTASLTVKGIYKTGGIDSLLGTVIITTQEFDRTFRRPRNSMAFVDVTGAASEDNLKAVLKPFPDVKVQTQSDFVDSQNQWITTMLRLIYVLLGFSVVVSFFGIVNTLVLSTFERTRELGMLRAVGMTRRQIRRMVRHESVITSLIGATLGVVLGIALAALVMRRLSQFSESEGGDGMTFTIPVQPLVIFALAAILAGIVAAILPARRASRLRILRALQYE
jgi:putative ABC transport system permease protein